jgi:hypothetical protein
MATTAHLVQIAETMTTAELKDIQRHQRARLLSYQRASNTAMAAFMQPRVDATAQVLAERKAAK